MTARPLMILAAATALSTGAVAQAAEIKAPPAAKPVDLAKFYSGTWIEIGRHPMKLTDGCVAGTTSYKIVTPTKIDVVDTCRDKTPSGKLKSLGGPGVIEDPGTNTKLKVRYKVIGLTVATWDYWVLDHDDDYTWFISANPAFTNLWIYTRDPHVDPALLKTLVGKAKALGYPVDQLEFPAQP